jgi:hypothetical protein
LCFPDVVFVISGLVGMFCFGVVSGQNKKNHCFCIEFLTRTNKDSHGMLASSSKVLFTEFLTENNEDSNGIGLPHPNDVLLMF